uniref:hypothetical protein n=1 Tax=Navicula avium TaxID=2018708 RepID=UPI0021820797|nr:hypothetical protein N4L39_pgp028 [Haslea avium]UVG41491.1 hypothetical protein [Haslea avium]
MMKVKEIEYDIPLRDLVDGKGSLDVIVTLEDGSNYLVEVTTPRFLDVLMEEKKFLPPGYPYIIVSEFTNEIIHAAIEEFIGESEDSYWLKLYHITASLDIKDVNEILERKEKEYRELEAQIEAEIKAKSKINWNTSSFKMLKWILGLEILIILLYIFIEN